MEIRPQPGPQVDFASSRADVVIYGGSAGGGKSFALLLEMLRHISNPMFRGVIFRRDYAQIMQPGGLWDEALKLYRPCGGEDVQGLGKFRFPSGAEITFHHLHLESDIYNWQGAQVPVIEFDELTHFTAEQFWYLLGRNRSTSGIKPYMRASCNPELDSWVEKLISWWIDQDESSPTYGLPIKSRSGKLRWFVRIDDTLSWADTPQALLDKHGDFVKPKSLTFIPAKLTDNKILMEADPGYMANLQAQTRLQRARLLDGNWKAAPNPGDWFRRGDFRIIAAPMPGTDYVRGWDFAATEPSETNPNPDRTATVLIGRQPNGRYVVAHARRESYRSGQVQEMVTAYAGVDGPDVAISIPIDPGAAGVGVADNYVSALAGYAIRPKPIRKGKTVYAEPFAIQVQRGMVDIVEAPWNDFYFAELEQFPAPRVHDDLVDASSIAFSSIVQLNDAWIDAAKESTTTSEDVYEVNEVKDLLAVVKPVSEMELLIKSYISHGNTQVVQDDGTDWM